MTVVKNHLPQPVDAAAGVAQVTAVLGCKEDAARVLLANAGTMAWFVKGGNEIEAARLKETIDVSRALFAPVDNALTVNRKALARLDDVVTSSQNIPPKVERTTRTELFTRLRSELLANVETLTNLRSELSAALNRDTDALLALQGEKGGVA